MELVMVLLLGMYFGMVTIWIEDGLDRIYILPDCYIRIGLGTVFSMWVWQWVGSFHEAAFLVLGGTILWMGASIDKQFFILPDEGACLLIVSGVPYAYFCCHRNLIDMLVLMGVVGLVGLLLHYGSGHNFGLGDVKWMASLSLWMTAWETYIFISLSFILGCLYLLWKKIYFFDSLASMYIPFGPPMALAASMVVLWHWY